MKGKAETEILLIGGSAGSISVLLELLPQLSDPLSFPVVIVVHRKAYADSSLDALLRFYSKKEISEVYDKMSLQKNCIYLAPADYHLLFEEKSQVALDASEKVNYSRPSIDVTFQSAAQIFGSHTAALLLSGANNDGMEGMQCVANVGGLVLVQDPDTAEVGFMPSQALKYVEVDKVLAPKAMAGFINQLNSKS